MKVVLFCGGLGLRLRDYSETIPKPMVPIGHRPILWHIMKYYAHFGHKDFILCLGWRGDAIKQYFLNYNECLTNDFTMSGGGENVSLLNRDIKDWNITFVDTGVSSNIGQRLKLVQPHLYGEEFFLANYADDLTDLHLPDMVDFFHQQNATASFLSVRPSQSFHSVAIDETGLVRNIQAVSESEIWINGGYFMFRREIFDYIENGEDLVVQPFKRLMAERKLVSMKYDGFWGCMDTYKERQCLEEMYTRGESPWEVWKRPLGVSGQAPASYSLERPAATVPIGTSGSFPLRSGPLQPVQT